MTAGSRQRFNAYTPFHASAEPLLTRCLVTLEKCPPLAPDCDILCRLASCQKSDERFGRRQTPPLRTVDIDPTMQAFGSDDHSVKAIDRLQRSVELLTFGSG